MGVKKKKRLLKKWVTRYPVSIFLAPGYNRISGYIYKIIFFLKKIGHF
jgi:hypothetical protein